MPDELKELIDYHDRVADYAWPDEDTREMSRRTAALLRQTLERWQNGEMASATTASAEAMDGIDGVEQCLRLAQSAFFSSDGAIASINFLVQAIRMVRAEAQKGGA